MGEDFDDRCQAGTLVVEGHPHRLPGGGPHLWSERIPLRSEWGGIHPPGCLADHRCDLSQPLSRRLTDEIRIAHREPIQHAPVHQGVDIRREDLQPLRGERGGDPVEDARSQSFIGAYRDPHQGGFSLPADDGKNSLSRQTTKPTQFLDHADRIQTAHGRSG